MRADVFERRIRWLKDYGYRIVSLEEGLAQIVTGSAKSRTAVITIDDGFASTSRIAAPILKKYGCTATIYITTYYVVNRHPVFRLAIQYAFWKADRKAMEAEGLPRALRPRDGNQSLTPEKIYEFGERHLDEEQRVELCRQVFAALGVDYSALVDAGGLNLVSTRDIAELSSQGFDVQLHTHRHDLPKDPTIIEKEIRENRAVLEPILGKKLRHLCYPSGVWADSQWESLRRLGIESATTTDPGMNKPATSLLALKRCLDRDDLPDIEFEAEMTGFKELIRLCRERVAWLFLSK